MPEPADMTVPDVARALGCSAPTVRQLVDRDLLEASAIWRGDRRYLRISEAALAKYLYIYGTFRRREASSLDTDLQALRAEVDGLKAALSDASKEPHAGRVIALEEAVHLLRAAAASNQEAEEARGRATASLLSAIRELEAADASRRTALRALDEAVGAMTNPRIPPSTEAL